MTKKFKKNTKDNRYYLSNETAEEIGRELNEGGRYRLSKKEVRLLKKIIDTNTPKIMVYDIETTRGLAEVWGTGKTYIGHTQMRTEQKILTVAWKWLGDDTVHYLKWDADDSPEGGDDRELMVKFLKEYNKADVVIGWNSDNFDNKLVNTRALKHRLYVNVYIKSMDAMKKAKQIFRQPSNSLAYYARFLGLGSKLQHTGLKMWQDIQWGAEVDAEEAMELMIKYNVQDIMLTEEIYLLLRPYMKSNIHLGALFSGDKTTCDNCGTHNLELMKTTATARGTIQRVCKCKKCGSQQVLSNTNYLKSKME
jgi:DNA polymerase elongation subunit (family B)